MAKCNFSNTITKYQLYQSFNYITNYKISANTKATTTLFRQIVLRKKQFIYNLLHALMCTFIPQNFCSQNFTANYTIMHRNKLIPSLMQTKLLPISMQSYKTPFSQQLNKFEIKALRHTLSSKSYTFVLICLSEHILPLVRLSRCGNCLVRAPCLTKIYCLKRSWRSKGLCNHMLRWQILKLTDSVGLVTDLYFEIYRTVRVEGSLATLHIPFMKGTLQHFTSLTVTQK